jgi:hypothetical protein
VKAILSSFFNIRGVGNKRGWGAKVVQSINADEVIIINEKGCKRCRISNKINEEGGTWKRIISEKDKICALRAEKYEKNNNRDPRLL